MESITSLISKSLCYSQSMADQRTYAFIDSQNLNLGVQKDIFRKGRKIYSGWRLDFKRFRVYLRDKYKVAKDKLGRLLIPNKRAYSSLLWKFRKDIDYISELKNKLEYKANRK